MHAVMGSGRVIAGRYRLNDPIGRGAMGIVWRGRDELLDRDVAVKEVQITAQAAPADAESIYQRTLREARTAARLSHPGVVTVFDVVEENGSPWIVMELVQARSLDRIITEDGPLPPPQAAELGASLVGALAAAHAAGVLHRDVKPSNVLVSGDGRAVLTDFGIATFAGDPGITQVGMVVGTPGFTAPERVRGGEATPASDLWSLGATLYAAVEGRGPFDRVGGDTAITTGVATEDAPRAPSAGPLGPVIDALLSRDPAARPDASTTASLLAAAVGAIAAGPSASDQRAAFLDPPVFAAPSMPAPAAAAPDGAAPAGVAGLADSGDGDGDGDGGGGGGARSRWRSSPASPDSGRRKLVLAAAGVVAVTVAGIAGWDFYPDSHSSQALGSQPVPGISATASTVAGQHSANGSGASGPPGATQGANPSAPPSGEPSGGSASKPGSSPSASPGSPGPSASPSPSPSPSPTSTAPVLPAGYSWHRLTAATMGSTAGFEIGLPRLWQQSVSGQSASFTQPVSNFHFVVNLASWTYAAPLTQAQYLQRKYAKADPGYRLLALGSIGFKAIGGYEAAPAAELKFKWTKPVLGTVTELIVVVTLTTKSGVQPYTLTLWAPSTTFSLANGTFETAMTTFRPLPS